jgi:hypothetical protein
MIMTPGAAIGIAANIMALDIAGPTRQTIAEQSFLKSMPAGLTRGSNPIGAKISEPFFDSYAVAVAVHGDAGGFFSLPVANRRAKAAA